MHPARARSVDAGEPSEVDNRGSAPKSYVDLLQARIKLLEQVLWTHSIDIDWSIAKLHSQRTEVAAGGPTAAYSSSTAFNEICADLEGALYVDEPLHEHEQASAEARFYGLTSGRLEISSSQDITSGSPGQEDSPEISFQSPDSTLHFTRLSGRATSAEASIIDELATPRVKEGLLDLYFQWEQPWLQLVDEKLFRQSLESNGRYSSSLLVCCILAVASRYSDDAEARSDPNDSNTAGALYAEAAEAMLQTEIEDPSITTVQSLGILGLYFIEIGSDSVGWLYMSMANRIVLDLGLNIDSRSVTDMAPLTSDEMRLRRQVYWALYCNDKLGASYTGRDSQAAVPLPALAVPDEDISDRTQDLIRLQRALATHCQILEKISIKLLASVAERRAFFDSTMFTLKGWFYSLPKELKVKTNSVNRNQTMLPQAYILSMVHYTSVVLLAKPFLRSGKGDTPESAEILQLASSVCFEAAAEICLLGERYREAFGSFRRSPLTATHCTLTAALVIMFLRDGSMGTCAQADQNKLDGCLQTLHELSVSWGPPLRYWRTLTSILIQRGSQDVTVDEAQVVDSIPVRSRPSDTENQHQPGDRAEVVPDMTVLASMLQDPGEANQYFAEHESTEQMFPDVAWLDVGAFDALSWDFGGRNALDAQMWGTGCSWQLDSNQ
ncbi:C6 transcription factor [Colletotrichum plurivorum]|uniref:C6 transcription factor n=1 Tax=Colletotrichum plurivorum TaxID=2175906 RepID=A0A8H6NCS1_9PEZI|nr:C6 transcription factor [Colletotrichum plurivorum]